MKKKTNNKKKLTLNYKYLFILLIICLIIGLIIYIYYKKIKDNFENEKNQIIIPNIIGGIGNQLFVIASAFSFSKDNNYKLMLDNRKDVYSYGKPRITYNDTLFHNIPIYSNEKNNFINISENEFVLNKTIDKTKNIFLTGGYYQEAKYFNKYRNEILNLFEPKQDIKEKINELYKLNNINIMNDFLVAIHIRLDDLYTPIDADKRVYDKDEYDTIIQKLPEHLQTNSNTKFILFSNNIPRTKEIFKTAQIDSSKIIYIHSEDYIELILMSKCNDYIASPSTFNWWGIYLNKNLEKKIFIYWKQDSDYRKDFYKKYEYLKDNSIINSINNNVKNNIETFNNNLLTNNKPILSKFTCVSGFWNVNNKHGNKFNEWFKTTLAINCPYVFFTSKENIKTIKKFRKNYSTYFIEKNISDFKTYKLNMTNNIHNIHVPSKELGLIWLEKINLVLEASIINPYKSEWFCWIDAAISIYRDNLPSQLPFPNPNKVHLLSKTQINYCTSENILNDELSKIKNWEYIHNISGTFIIHISLVKTISNLFYKYLNMCIYETNNFICYSDQCILSRLYLDYPELFNKIGDGYGQIIKELI